MSDLFNLFSNRKITTAESVAESKAFCMKPWVHLFVSQYGSVVPCCLTPWDKEGALGDVNKQSIQEIWNGSEMKQFRKTLLKDQQDPRCNSCYESERNGLKSTRKMTNMLYADKLDWALDTKRNGFSEKAKPIFWDIFQHPSP
jgi:radical SAM protein with 4Fe4S-binding SPASM domain